MDSGSAQWPTAIVPGSALRRRRVLQETLHSQRSHYVCEPMSVDHTGFNPDEVSRLQREHPGEHGIVDPRSGRVHSLATSRAFGDSYI